MPKRIEIQLYNARTGESLTLPLNPETTDLENAVDIKTYNVLGFGEVPTKGVKTLQRLNLSNILPEDDTFFAQLASLISALNWKPYNLKETITMLNRWVDDQDIIRIIIADRLNKLFRLERYVDQVRESTPASGYEISAVEYRNPADKISITENPKSGLVSKLKERTINRYIPNEKVATAGQTIYKIAKLNYGGNFDALANANGIYNKNADIAGKIVKMLPL